MVYCINCGQRLSEGANFCAGCGKAVNDSDVCCDNSQRKIIFEGEIRKCPNCGECVPSFTALCPACNYEFRGSSSSGSINELSAKLEQATTDEKRVNLIRTFPIPNTREDILEFMILASTNIENSFRGGISEAWAVKFEQAYEKSIVLFGEQPEFFRLHTLCTKKKKANDRIIKKKKLSRKREKAFEANKSWFLPVVISFVSIIALVAAVAIPRTIKVRELDGLINEVEICIAAGDYETARLKAEQIIDDGGWSEVSEAKYSRIRRSLLNTIEQMEVAAGHKIYVGVSLENMKALNYLDVIDQLQGRGFNNIRAIAIKDLVTGILVSDGQIEDITINGERYFGEDSAYPADAEIIITYHTYKWN